MEIIIAGGVLCAVLMIWSLWTGARLERLGTRIRSARSSLDAQLVRRAAAAQAIAATGVLDPELADRLRAAVRAAVEADDDGVREIAENRLGTVLRDLPADIDPDLRGDLLQAAQRVQLARSFYNDAVRDTRALRRRRLARVVVLLNDQPEPAFFEIADTVEPRRPVGRPS